MGHETRDPEGGGGMTQGTSRRLSGIGIKIIGGLVLQSILLSTLATSAEAVPAFARKYDLSCTSCHTKPPRLNPFGEAFHMAGFQIPGTEEGQTKKKRRIGRIWSETEFGNIFSIRTTGDFIQSFQGGEQGESEMVFPKEIEIYLAGTLTDDVSYFFEFEHATRKVEGDEAGLFEEKSEFGLGKEFFLMFDLSGLLSSSSEGMDGKDKMAGPMLMGPMVMVGRIDPSTNFSYPTNRQLILNVPGRVGESGVIERFGMTPYAFASKFFGMRTTHGESVEVTKSVLYNTSGDFGIDLHAMAGPLMVQAGVMQGLQSGTADGNQKKDPYVMARLNFGGKYYTSGSLSALAYWGNDTGRVPMSSTAPGGVLVDWFRYGLAANIKYKLLDIYGAVIRDEVRGLPDSVQAVFDDRASGVTIQGDFLATDHLLISLRYDQLEAGGFIVTKTDGRVMTVQTRYYLRDNVSLYLRDSYNLEGVSRNPLRNYRNLISIGADLDF